MLRRTCSGFQPMTSLVAQHPGIQFLDFGLERGKARLSSLGISFGPSKHQATGYTDALRILLHRLISQQWRLALRGRGGEPQGQAGRWRRATRSRAVRRWIHSTAKVAAAAVTAREGAGQQGCHHHTTSGPTELGPGPCLPSVHARPRRQQPHRIILAFDTLLLPRSANAPCAAPEPSRAAVRVRCTSPLTWPIRVKNRWFPGPPWV